MLMGMAIGTVLTGGFGPKVHKSDGLTTKERVAKRLGKSVENSESKAMRKAGYAKGLGLKPQDSIGLTAKKAMRNRAFSRAGLHVPISSEELGTAYLGIMQNSLEKLYADPKHADKYRNEANESIALVYDLGTANGVSTSDVDTAARRIARQFDNYRDVEIGFGPYNNMASSDMFSAFQIFMDGGNTFSINEKLSARMNRGVSSSSVSNDGSDGQDSGMPTSDDLRDMFNSFISDLSDANVQNTQMNSQMNAQFMQEFFNRFAEMFGMKDYRDSDTVYNDENVVDAEIVDDEAVSVEDNDLSDDSESSVFDSNDSNGDLGEAFKKEVFSVFDTAKSSNMIGSQDRSLLCSLNLQSVVFASTAIASESMSSNEALSFVPDDLGLRQRTEAIANELTSLCDKYGKLEMDEFLKSGNDSFKQSDFLNKLRVLGEIYVEEEVLDSYTSIDDGVYPVSDPKAHFDYVLQTLGGISAKEKSIYLNDATLSDKEKSIACVSVDDTIREALNDVLCNTSGESKYTLVGKANSKDLYENGELTFEGKLCSVCDALRFDANRMCLESGFQGGAHDFLQERAFMAAAVSQYFVNTEELSADGTVKPSYFDVTSSKSPDFAKIENALRDIRDAACDGYSVSSKVMDVFSDSAKELLASGNFDSKYSLNNVTCGLDNYGRISCLDFDNASVSNWFLDGKMPDVGEDALGKRVMADKLNSARKVFETKNVEYIDQSGVGKVVDKSKIDPDKSDFVL